MSGYTFQIPDTKLVDYYNSYLNAQMTASFYVLEPTLNISNGIKYLYVNFLSVFLTFGNFFSL